MNETLKKGLLSTIENGLLFAAGIFFTVFGEQLKSGVDIPQAAATAGMAALTTTALWVGVAIKGGQQVIARATTTGGEYPGKKAEAKTL